jgi:hypothetical protein
MRVIRYWFLIALVLVFSACGGSSELVGRWYLAPNSEGDLGVIEFRGDRSFAIQDAGARKEGVGKYALVGKEHVVLDIYGNEPVTITLKYSLAGDTLSLTDEAGKTVQFLKEK